MIAKKKAQTEKLTLDQARGGKAAKKKSVSHISVTTTSTEMPLGETRESLMLKAKERGIKYFRILNKQELADILKLTLDEDRSTADDIVARARGRWKSGWGSRKQTKKTVEA